VRDLDDLFRALARSRFRVKFTLLCSRQGLPARQEVSKIVIEHAAGFIDERLAPAEPSNDGKQTPWRGHPAFVAQHATGTCCRSCLAKWHHIPKGRELTADERRYVVAVIRRWIIGQNPPAAEPRLF
jgi:hypothetical protein